MASTTFTPKKAKLVIDKLADGSSIAAAMSSVGVERTLYYHWREVHDGFAAAADAAIESGTDRLEDIAKQRAEDSSDTLLIFLLKARRRDKYGDKQAIDLSGELRTIEIKEILVPKPAELDG